MVLVCEWRDSFHTGFVLRCLMKLDSVDPAIDDAVRRGAEAYLRFFDADGRAKLWADKRASPRMPIPPAPDFRLSRCSAAGA